MGSPNQQSDLEAMLRHEPWLRGLVRGMVGDAATAEDVTQQTWLSALRMPPSDRRNLRGWLSTVARNQAARERRRQARRRRHERLAAQPATAATAPDIELDIDTRQRLLQAVRALDEPYRETIWRRYFERCTTAEIAAAQGVTTSTVRTRIARGLALLRGQLAPEHSRRKLSALPLWWLFGSLPGGWLLATGNKVAALLAVSCLAFAGLWYANHDPALAPQLAEDDPHVAAERAAGAAGEPGTTADRTAAIDDRPREPDPIAAAPAVLDGIVLDPAGNPVAAVPVTWTGIDAPAAATVTSAPDGTFSLPIATAVTSDDPTVATAGADWVTLRSWPHDGDGRASIVVAPAVAFAGKVVDDRGEPIADAEIEVSAVELKQFPTSLERHRGLPSRKQRSDAQGRFRFEDVPDTPDTRIAAARVGYRVRFATLPAGGSRDHTIVLEREWQDRMHGIVVDRAGNPVAGAAVDWGIATATSDATGHFHCPWPPQGTNGMRMVVVAPGHRALARKYDRDTWEREGRPDPVRLVLGEPPLTITGTASHADGTPATGMHVAVLDVTMLFSHQPQTTAEAIAAGHTGQKPIEAGSVRSDGAFSVGGLSERSYRLVLWDPKTLLAVESEPIAAGTRGVALVLPSDAMRATLRGRVLSRAGSPLAGVEVAPVLQLLPGIGGQARNDRRVLTDEQGRFELDDVPRRGNCWIGLTGDPVVGLFHPVEDFADRDFVELRADARCRVRFLAGSPTVDASYLIFVDADDQHVPMWSMTDNGMTPKNFVKLDGEQSAMFSIAESARWLLYYRAGKEVHRRAVQLVPAELNRIAP